MRALFVQTMETTAEMIQGPCVDNQRALIACKVIESATLVLNAVLESTANSSGMYAEEEVWTLVVSVYDECARDATNVA